MEPIAVAVHAVNRSGAAPGDRTLAEFSSAAAVLGHNPWLLDVIVTHRYALSDSTDAFREAADRAAGPITVLFEPDRGDGPADRFSTTEDELSPQG